MDYPEHFLRGMTNKNCIFDNCTAVSPSIFNFSEDQVRDRWMLNSVCWEDDDLVVDQMLRQKKQNDEIQWKAGIARFPTDRIDYINKLPASRNLMSYERETFKDNPYHGNLLLKRGTEPRKIRLISATIAMHVSSVIPQK